MNLRNTVSAFLLLIGWAAFGGCRHVEYISDTETTHSDEKPDAGGDAGDIESWDAPKNVVLFIGDGMGQSHIAAAGMYENGAPGTLFFESFPVHGLVSNESASDTITDSAAAATAMACGQKVYNSVVAMAIPGDGRELPSLVDFYKHRQQSTGLVTTTYITHATPAAFAAHAVTRGDVTTIAWHYLHTGRPEILFGGGGCGMVDEEVAAQGYTVIHTLDGFDMLQNTEGAMIAGLFGEGFYPYEASGVTDRPHLYGKRCGRCGAVVRRPGRVFCNDRGRHDRSGRAHQPP